MESIYKQQINTKYIKYGTEQSFETFFLSKKYYCIVNRDHSGFDKNILDEIFISL